MKKRKSPVKIKTTDQEINFKFLNAIGKVQSMEARLNNLVTYTEYIASVVDLAVSYTEFVSNILADNRNTQVVGKFGYIPTEQIPTFLEFKAIKRKESEDEIPF